MHVITELRDSEASKNHLELDQLGQVLQVIGSKLPGQVSVTSLSMHSDTPFTLQELCLCQGRLTQLCLRLGFLIF